MRGFPECPLPSLPFGSAHWDVRACRAGGSLRVSAEGSGEGRGSAGLGEVGAVSPCAITGGLGRGSLGPPRPRPALRPHAALAAAALTAGLWVRRFKGMRLGEALPPPNLGNFGSSCLPKPGPGSGLGCRPFSSLWPGASPHHHLGGKPACLAWHPASLSPQRPHCEHPADPLGS